MVFLVLVMALVIFYLLKKTVIENQKKYPPTTDCVQLDDMFASNVSDPSFIGVAFMDKDSTLDYNGTGLYYCYCSLYLKTNSLYTVLYDGDTTDQAVDANFCFQYAHDNLKGSALSTLVSLSVSVINIILRTVNMFLISLIGYHTESN